MVEGMEKYVHDKVLFQSADIYTPGSVATSELRFLHQYLERRILKYEMCIIKVLAASVLKHNILLFVPYSSTCCYLYHIAQHVVICTIYLNMLLFVPYSSTCCYLYHIAQHVVICTI